VICLVTGGCGFVGSALVRRLVTEGHEVVVVDDMSRGSPENLGPSRDQVTVVEQNVTAELDQILASFRPEAVFHLAAMHFIPDCDADPLRCLEVNVEGTRAVLEATAALPHPASVVLASSAAVYAPADGPHQEEDPLGPIDVYGYSKRWAEELTWSFGVHASRGVGIARLFNVFGPGETNPHFIPSLIYQLQAGETVHLGNLSSKRDYVFVDDVGEALVRLAGYCHSGQSVIVNVGSGRSYDGHEVVQTLTGISVGSAPSTPTVDPSRIRAVDRPSLLANRDLAYKILGWTPRTSLQDGLQAAWERPLGTEVTIS
jgi:UDP-glucose 4-epimerase